MESSINSQTIISLLRSKDIDDFKLLSYVDPNKILNVLDEYFTELVCYEKCKTINYVCYIIDMIYNFELYITTADKGRELVINLFHANQHILSFYNPDGGCDHTIPFYQTCVITMKDKILTALSGLRKTH